MPATLTPEEALLTSRKKAQQAEKDLHENAAHQQAILAASTMNQALEDRLTSEDDAESTPAAPPPTPEGDSVSVVATSTDDNESKEKKSDIRTITKEQLTELQKHLADFKKLHPNADIQGNLYQCKNAEEFKKLPKNVREAYGSTLPKFPLSLYVLSGSSEQLQAFQDYVSGKNPELAAAVFPEKPAPDNSAQSNASLEAGSDAAPSPLPASPRVQKVREEEGVALRQQDDRDAALVQGAENRRSGPGNN